MKQSKGITLISLVVTIIVLIILAGVSILELTNNGIFEKVKEAKIKFEEAKNDEEDILNNYIDDIDKFLGYNSENNETKENIKGTTIDFWGGKINVPFNGDGTEKNPYQITCSSELAFLSMMVNFGECFEGKYFDLSNNINLNENKYTINPENGEIIFSIEAREWIPIGNEKHAFKGVFDGKNHMIKGIYINDDSVKFQALFGSNEGTIRNICLSEGYIYGKGSIGGICGNNNKNGLIEKCSSNIIIIASEKGAGGICGTNDGTIQQCYNKSNVTTIDVYAGGICGYNNGTIKYCYNLGMITSGKNDSGNSYVGGIVGRNYFANVQYTYNIGKIVNTEGNAYLGGIIGQSNSGNLYNSYSSTLSNVIGRDYPSAGITENAQIMTQEEMKTEDFIALIGGNDYWKIDEKSGNIVLKWQ